MPSTREHVRGHVLSKLDQRRADRAAYERALALTEDPALRDYMVRQRSEFQVLRESMPKPRLDAVHAFKTQQAFARWMKANHDQQSEVFLRIYKKDSDVPTVTVSEALDVVLCWGWIDGVRYGHDEQSFLQRYTPRRAKSRWSQINRDHVQRLIASGQMTEHGLAEVEAAKRDGRWDAAYASAKSMVVPDDLLEAIERNPRAKRTFASLNKQNLYALGFRMSRITTPAGREKSIRAWVTRLARGETPHPQTKRVAKS